LKSLKKESFLDVGCGFGRWGMLIRTYSNPMYLVGIDIWKPYLMQIKHKRIYDDLILADASNLPIAKKAVDIGLAFEIIEHLPASKGRLLLASLETISRKSVILSTPNFKYLQDEVGGNPYQKHVSFWKHQNFPKKYEIRGIGVQIKGKIFLSAMPILGYFLSKLILFGKLCKFSELIVAMVRLKKRQDYEQIA
jgi:SAM-dependent methyltransferase